MSATKGAEDNVYQAAKKGLGRWLTRARELVMAPYKLAKATPDPQAIFSADPIWQGEVDRILAALTPALREGWAGAHLPGNYDPQDPFIQANLAMTRNLLVRIPGETHALIVSKILKGVNAGQTVDQIAAVVDNVLTFTGSENWDSRARVIAQTETTRHFSSSMLAHGLLVERQDGTPLQKSWETQTDGKERAAHRRVDHQKRPLSQPFDVDGVAMLFPCDPNAPADLVCNCRCWMMIEKAAS